MPCSDGELEDGLRAEAAVEMVMEQDLRDPLDQLTGKFCHVAIQPEPSGVPTMRVFHTFEEIEAAAGEEIGTTDWVEITQARVNKFADATGDHQWIHVDVERAKAGPFGGTIAHGYLTLSLVPWLGSMVFNLQTPG